ncbi:MAG: amino acid ABC transporter permease [Paracoccaceae bacterium]|jgi:polar amino acid transport system permease protein|nr:amino acid ABC transporter permease [Paracoccaceae bacterium]
MHTWDFLATLADMDLLLLGLWNTIKVFIFALAFGIPLGFGLALGRMSRIPVLSQICSLIIEFFRTTPPLVQLFWFFFAFPILISVQMTPFVASVMTFSIQSSAFFAEIFRGGINSIDKGQWEAAKAIGMTRQSSLRRIILPQAVKRMIPAFAERSIELLKTTTLISTVSYADLMFQANDLASKTFRPLEVYTVVAVMYFFLILIFSQLTIRLEYRLARSGEGTLR